MYNKITNDADARQLHKFAEYYNEATLISSIVHGPEHEKTVVCRSSLAEIKNLLQLTRDFNELGD